MDPHPLTATVARLRTELSDLREVPAWSLDASATRDALVELSGLASQVAEAEARMAAHAEATQVHEDTGATSVAAWWANATRQTRTAVRRKIAFGALLERHDPTRVALGAGDVLPDQASVILDAVESLPDEVSSDTAVLAEKHLLGEAAHHDAKSLRILGRHILTVLDPAAGEAHEAKLLEAEERDAQRAARLSMVDDGHGKTHGRFTLPTLHAAMLKKALLAIAAPKHQQAVNGPQSHTESETGPAPLTTPERLGRALCEYLERYPADALPQAGGISATVVVTMTLDSLMGGLASAAIDTGDRISATQARRLACEAGLIPAVLNTTGAVLDVGRTARFHNKAQRIAMGIEQQGCLAEGCDAPPSMCQAHHLEPWAQGGCTSVKDGALLCSRHHTLIHLRPDLVRLRTRPRLTGRRDCQDAPPVEPVERSLTR